VDDIQEALAEFERQKEFLPDAVPHVCNECPWRRESCPGYLGPYDAFQWVNRLTSEGAIECHKTVSGDDQPWEEVKQCRGAAIVRGNIGKMPRNEKVVVGPVDKETCFATPQEFVEHHTGGIK
jgi:hypothetical protein